MLSRFEIKLLLIGAALFSISIYVLRSMPEWNAKKTATEILTNDSKLFHIDVIKFLANPYAKPFFNEWLKNPKTDEVLCLAIFGLTNNASALQKAEILKLENHNSKRVKLCVDRALFLNSISNGELLCNSLNDEDIATRKFAAKLMSTITLPSSPKLNGQKVHWYLGIDALINSLDEMDKEILQLKHIALVCLTSKKDIHSVEKWRAWWDTVNK